MFYINAYSYIDVNLLWMIIDDLHLIRFYDASKLLNVHRWWPVNSPHKGPVARKKFPLDNVHMC